MKKTGFIEKTGVILEKLPDAKFLIKLDEEEKNVIAYLAGKMIRFRVKVFVGDRVKIEFSEYDLDNGRINYKLK